MHTHVVTDTPRLRSAPQGGDYRAHMVSYFKSHNRSNIEISRLLGEEQTMRSVKGIDLRQAAKEIGFNGGREALKAFLKEQGCTYGKDIPHRQLVQQGLLTTDLRSHTIADRITKQYSVLLVTGDGLSWLRELAEKHGKTTQTLRRRDHGADQQGGAEGSASASTAAFA